MLQHRPGDGSSSQAADPPQTTPQGSGTSSPFSRDLTALLQVPDLAVWQWNVAGNRLDWNESLLRLYGVNTPPSDDLSFLAFVHPEDRERVEAETLSYVSGATSFSHEFRILRPDGEERHVLDRGLVQRDEAGRAVRMLGVNFDVTAERRAQERAAAMEHRAVLASRIADFVTWEIDAETSQVTYDTGLASLFGMAPGQKATCVDDFAACIHPDDIDRPRASLERARVPGGRYFAEFRVGSEEAGWRWLRGCGEGVATPQGLRIIGFNVDITELHRAEEARQLLLDELDHRLKNLFVIAISLVSMTARTARTPAEMAVALRGRLLALSHANDLIRPAVQARAAGGQGAPVADLIRVVVAPYLSRDPARIVVDGHAVQAGPKAATSLSLVFHELATNAAKYGGLSVPKGSLVVAWHEEDGALVLTWREQGGPALLSPPARTGFGSQLARLGVTDQLGGSIAYDWQPAGVVVTLTVPLEHLAE